MPIVNIKMQGGKMIVTAPYNSDFVPVARKALAGDWNGTSWIFDARDEARVRERCMLDYGSDGIVDDVVTLRVNWTTMAYEDRGPYTLAGRVIARAFGRDSGAKTGDGVIVLAGGFTSGGSMKNWDTRVKAGTVALVRDFPRVVAEQFVKEQPDGGIVYAIEPEQKPVDAKALREERARLQARMDEIDAALATVPQEPEG